MMTKKKSMGLVAALLLGAASLGPTTLVSHIRAMRDVLRGELQGMSSDLQEAARIRVLLRDMVEGLLAFQEKIGDVSVRAEAAERKEERCQKELDSETAILTRSKSMLDDEGRQQYQIGNKVYTRQQLADDGKARLKHCQELKAKIDFERDISAKLRAAEREGIANLRKAEQVKVEKQEELKELEIRLANAGLLRQVNELAGKLGDNPLQPQTELGEAFAEFRKRVRTAERQGDYLSAESKNGLIVDWSPDTGSDAEVSQAISQFLGGTAKP